jgi:putative membrane protein
MKFPIPLNFKKVRGVIITLYVVGIIGWALPLTRNLFIILTPVILLVSFALLINFHTPFLNRKIALVFLIIFLASYFTEVAGVRTGLIFGAYSYGKGLGPKLLDTPLLIGLNWVLLVYCSAAIVEKVPVGNIGKATGASLLMVLYDLVMEQVAPYMDMWSFGAGTAPLRNYISWFILALIFHLLLRVTCIKLTNRLAPFIFYCQFLFFIVLLIFFKIAE